MSNLQFEVQYYDDDHKSKLEELAIRDELQSAVAHGMSIPEQEVLVYTVFREQKQGVAGWETFDELKSRLPNRLPVFTNTSISPIPAFDHSFRARAVPTIRRLNRRVSVLR